MTRLLKAAVAILLLPASAGAAPLFCDNFGVKAKPAWGNERGAWRTGNHQYDATNPNNSPNTYTDVTTLPALKDFTVTVTVNALNDGGVWLRSAWNNGAINGILLVTGGNIGTNNGFYWHVFTNGSASPELSPVSVPGLQGSTAALKIAVRGNTYSLYLNGGKKPISVLTDSTYASGSAGLYDFSPTGGGSTPRGETFSKFCILPAP